MSKEAKPIDSIRYKTDLISSLKSLEFRVNGTYEEVKIILVGQVNVSYPESVQELWKTKDFVNQLNDQLKVIIDLEVLVLKNEIGEHLKQI